MRMGRSRRVREKEEESDTEQLDGGCILFFGTSSWFVNEVTAMLTIFPIIASFISETVAGNVWNVTHC